MTSELVPASGAVALVSDGLAVYKVDQDNMMRVAAERPRDEIKVLSAVLRELDLSPEEASLSYYDIPYKDGDRTVHVEGPSIKAAMTLARRWGNCAVKAALTSEDAAAWNLSGVFVDFETSFREERPLQCLKSFRRRDGRTQMHTGKQAEAAFAAGVSKAMRNAILAGLPAWLVRRYFTRAKEIVGASTRVPDVLRAFLDAFGVTRDQLEKHVGTPAEQWKPDTIAQLRGVYNAIRDGQSTVDEVFPKPAAPGPAPGALTTAGILGGTVTGRDTEGPGPDAPPAAPTAPAFPTGSTSPAAPQEAPRAPGAADRPPMPPPVPPRPAPVPPQPAPAPASPARADDEPPPRTDADGQALLPVAPPSAPASETELALKRGAVVALRDRLRLSEARWQELCRAAGVTALGAAGLDALVALHDALTLEQTTRGRRA